MSWLEWLTIIMLSLAVVFNALAIYWNHKANKTWEKITRGRS